MEEPKALYNLDDTDHLTKKVHQRKYYALIFFLDVEDYVDIPKSHSSNDHIIHCSQELECIYPSNLFIPILRIKKLITKNLLA